MSTPSSYFNLSGWKIALPVDATGKFTGAAVEAKQLAGFENPLYFYDDASGAMVFAAPVNGATTSGSKYPRSELREMNGTSLAQWDLKTGGFMSATLAVNEVPTTADGTAGRIVVGQIHGAEEELVRVYWENGTVYFQNDQAGAKNSEMRFDLKNASGQTPNISLNEKFTYTIDAHGDTLIVKVYADGQVYTSTSTINDVWDTDSFYFKAGVYLGVNDDQHGSGEGKASFYDLSYNHDAATTPVVTTPVVITPPADTVTTTPALPAAPAETSNAITGTASADTLRGTAGNDTIKGLAGNDSLKGQAGDDRLEGGDGNDNMEGNDGNDTLVGGVGADTMKGGTGSDTFVWNALNEGGDHVSDFTSSDHIDLSSLIKGLPGGGAQALEGGYLRFVQVGADVRMDVDIDGAGGAATWTSLSTFDGIKASSISASQISVSTTPIPVATVAAPTTATATQYNEINGLAGKDSLSGTAKADALHGLAGDDYLKGLEGDDLVNGGAGNDKLEGNAGNDRLIGGAGNDTMKGGDGKDAFVFQSGHGHDIITDLRAEDTLVFDHSYFANAEAVRAAFTQTNGHFYLNTGGGNDIVFDNTTLSDISHVAIQFI